MRIRKCRKYFSFVVVHAPSPSPLHPHQPSTLSLKKTRRKIWTQSSSRHLRHSRRCFVLSLHAMLGSMLSSGASYEQSCLAAHIARTSSTMVLCILNVKRQEETDHRPSLEERKKKGGKTQSTRSLRKDPYPKASAKLSSCSEERGPLLCRRLQSVFFRP